MNKPERPPEASDAADAAASERHDPQEAEPETPTDDDLSAPQSSPADAHAPVEETEVEPAGDDREARSDAGDQAQVDEADTASAADATAERGEETDAKAHTEARPASPAQSDNPRLRWYVVHTYSGHEQKAKRHLESAIEIAGRTEQFGRVIIPTEQVTEMKQGKKSTSTRKFLPSYLLVEMELNKETRHLVTNCPGITNFVGAGGKPQPLGPEEVEHIIGHMEKGPVLKTDEMPYSAGDAVKVTDGPFADFSGVVSEVIPERKKLKVMVSIFGRPTPVELDYLQVQPA
jgi:transcriptional antiterminator NusG